MDDRAQLGISAAVKISLRLASNFGLDQLSTLGPCYSADAVLHCVRRTRAGTRYRRAPERAVLSGADWQALMVKFYDDPEKIKLVRSLKIMRTPSYGVMSAVLLNPEPVCCAVHWVGERTIPHNADGPCDFCTPENPLKLECYFGAWLTGQRMRFIYGMTDFAAQPILQHYRDHGSLRGQVVNAHRPNSRPNGRISVERIGTSEYWELLSPAIDVRKHLTYVFEVNRNHIDMSERRIPTGQALDDLRR